MMRQVNKEIKHNASVVCEDQVKMIVDVFVDKKLKLYITNLKKSMSFLLINVYGSGELRLNIQAQEDSILNYLWVNYVDISLEVKEHIALAENAVLKANYVELSKGEHKKETIYYFEGEGSEVTLKSASVVHNKIDWDMKADHHAKYTTAQLDNYVVGLKDSKFRLRVSGHIFQSQKKSETHQVTRVLNLFDEVESIVLPELLIDENDVAASHACTIGQPDEEAIYYLQSRGLSKGDALKLIVLGYLLYITEDIEEEDIKEQITLLIQTNMKDEYFEKGGKQI